MRLFRFAAIVVVAGSFFQAGAAGVLLAADQPAKVALLVGGGMMAVAGVAVLVQAGPIDRSIEAYAGPLREGVASLRRLAIFRGASRATLEHVAEVMREEPVEVGTVVVR